MTKCARCGFYIELGEIRIIRFDDTIRHEQCPIWSDKWIYPDITPSKEVRERISAGSGQGKLF